MSKQDRAAELIEFGAKRGYTPEQTATLLNELNLLAPDLPGPSRGMDTSGAVWYLPGPIGDIRRMREHIVIFGHDYNEQSFRLVLNEAEADTIARTILAAAQYAEEE
mgnify:CR=1 FL=1